VLEVRDREPLVPLAVRIGGLGARPEQPGSER
jgi:hypothetical protein